MKKHQNDLTLNTVQNLFKKPRVSAFLDKRIFRLAHPALFMYGLLITLYGCGKPSDNPMPEVEIENPTGCAIASDVDQALGIRNFEYDDKGLLVKMTGPNYYYGPFVRTITAAKAIDAYPSSTVDGNGHHYYGDINITYSYSGGSGNIYNGDPEFLHYLFVASNPPSTLKKDEMYQFKYDTKKHLVNVLIAGSGSQDADNFILFRYELQFTYDAHDNVTQAKVVYDWSKKIIDLPSGESRIDYKQTSDESINITYDDKPSPYTAISKYWKFIGGDFSGFGAYNLDNLRFWAGRCAILSKNNPVKITGKLITAPGAAPANINASLTYEYNDKNLPVSMAINGAGTNAFTYNCK
jgi:hypothetical protein